MALRVEGSLAFYSGFVFLQELGSVETGSGWDWDGNQTSLSKQEYLCGTVLMSLSY